MKKTIRILGNIVFVSLCGLVFIIPFSKAGIEIFGCIAIGSWIVLKGLRIKDKRLSLNKKQFLWFKKPIFIAIAVFFLANLLSCITSLSFGHSVRALLTKTTEYLLFFLITVDILTTRKRAKTLIYIMLISLILLCVNGIIQYITGFDLVRRYPLTSAFRINGSFLHPNDFSNYLVIFTPILLALGLSKKIFSKYRFLILIVFFMAVFCLVFSYTRASWLGFLAGMSFFTFGINKKLFLGFLAILVIGLFIMPAGVKNRLKQIDSLEEVSSDHRIIMWQEALSIIEDWPVLGTGLNTYTLVGPRYKIHPQGGIYPHNSYLHMAAEIGIAGLGAFIWFLFTIFKRAIVSFRQAKDEIYKVLILGLMAGLVGFLVNAFFDTTLFAIRLITIFWIMSGVLVALCNMAEGELR